MEEEPTEMDHHPFLRSPVVVEGRMSPGQWVKFLVEINALNSLQCFNTVGWVTGRASGQL